MLTFTQFLESPINLHVFVMREEAGASGKNMHHPAIHLHRDSHHFHSYQSMERASFDFQRVPALWVYKVKREAALFYVTFKGSLVIF